jgi:Fe2+ or Zn2+ uptake regulation protein
MATASSSAMKRKSIARHGTADQDEPLRQLIAAAGIKPSQPRTALLSALKEHAKPATPEDLFQLEWPGIPRALASIYRSLAELHQAGLIHRYVLGDRGKIAYGAGDLGRGFLLLCARCGASSFMDSRLEEAVRAQALAIGYDLVDGAPSLSGVCEACRQAEIHRLESVRHRRKVR